MNSFFQKIRAIFSPKATDEEVVLKFVKYLEDLNKNQVSCAEMYAKLDEFVEREVSQHDAARIMPLLREHLDMCSHCCDEYEALLDVLENTK